MNPIQKTLLTTAFEALGPERVTRGLKATGHSWRTVSWPSPPTTSPMRWHASLKSAGARSITSARCSASGCRR